MQNENQLDQCLRDLENRRSVPEPDVQENLVQAGREIYSIQNQIQKLAHLN